MGKVFCGRNTGNPIIGIVKTLEISLIAFGHLQQFPFKLIKKSPETLGFRRSITELNLIQFIIPYKYSL